MQQATTGTARSALPTTLQIALALLGFLAIGPLVTGLDLWLRFLPDYPAIRNFYAADALGHVLWIGSGFLALATIALIVKRQLVIAAVASAAFAAANAYGAELVWSRTTIGCWLAIGAFVLVAAAAYSARRGA